jgi:glycolate oxidase
MIGMLMNAQQQSALDELMQVVGIPYLITLPEELCNFSRDCASGRLTIPLAAVLPGTVEEIAAVVKICNKYKLRLSAMGGGTGVSGGALAEKDGVVLSLRRLDNIVEINKIDRTVTVEAGVITGVLQQKLLEHGLCFPQNISSAGSCSIGGNVAVSSGSPKSLKYGATKNFVLNLQVVLPDGEIIWTGKNITKNATGYNLTQLFVGSEGSLGIITKVVLQLTVPLFEVLLMVPFSHIDRLFDAVHQLFLRQFSPSSIEFIDRTGYQLASAHLQYHIPSKNEIDGVLWIELEGRYKDKLLEDAAEICGD